MKLPVLLSVPHGGLLIPEELADYTLFTEKLIKIDSDSGSKAIYHPLERHVAGFVTIPYARCFVDMNRADDDRRSDGVVKTHAAWGHKLYHTTPPEETFQAVIGRYHTPYHQRLSELALSSGAKLGVDCHTMCEFAPPNAPDSEGVERPMVCLSDKRGESISAEWMDRLMYWFGQAFEGFEVRKNSPFSGGYITRRHMTELPFIQIEISRTNKISDAEKGIRVLEALTNFSTEMFGVDYSPVLRREKLRRRIMSIFEFFKRLFSGLGLTRNLEK